MRFLVLLLAAVALLAVPNDALACSCLQWGNPKEELAKAKGGFVGVYLSRKALPGSPGAAIYRFRVERRLKGTFGKQNGKRYGLLLRRERGRWHSSLCEQRSARFFRGLPSRRLAFCA